MTDMLQWMVGKCLDFWLTLLGGHAEDWAQYGYTPIPTFYPPA